MKRSIPNGKAYLYFHVWFGLFPMMIVFYSFTIIRTKSPISYPQVHVHRTCAVVVLSKVKVFIFLLVRRLILTYKTYTPIPILIWTASSSLFQKYGLCWSFELENKWVFFMLSCEMCPLFTNPVRRLTAGVLHNCTLMVLPSRFFREPVARQSTAASLAAYGMWYTRKACGSDALDHYFFALHMTVLTHREGLATIFCSNTSSFSPLWENAQWKVVPHGCALPLPEGNFHLAILLSVLFFLALFYIDVPRKRWTASYTRIRKSVIHLKMWYIDNYRWHVHIFDKVCKALKTLNLYKFNNKKKSKALVSTGQTSWEFFKFFLYFSIQSDNRSKCIFHLASVYLFTWLVWCQKSKLFLLFFLIS